MLLILKLIIISSKFQIKIISFYIKEEVQFHTKYLDIVPKLNVIGLSQFNCNRMINGFNLKSHFHVTVPTMPKKSFHELSLGLVL